MVGFYHLRGLGPAFDDVRVNGPLSQEINPLQLSGFFLEYADELAADDLALLFRVGNALQLS